MPRAHLTASHLVSQRRSLAWDDSGPALVVLDQTRLPHEEREIRLTSWQEAGRAIREMQVRGAPLIGVTAGYALALAARVSVEDRTIEEAAASLRATRPTAVNLGWALDRVLHAMLAAQPSERAAVALAAARAIEREEEERSRRIGAHGAAVLAGLARRADHASETSLLTHCNTGWLATVGPGTALAIVYAAQEAGLPLRVWVDETRPRSQGARLTTWELARAGVPCTLIADTAAGHLLQNGRVDACLVGCDRATATGDVCNKIGTYALALAARDNGVPFYVALPASSVDWGLDDAAAIPIEVRDAEEVTHVGGQSAKGGLDSVRIAPEGVAAANFAFDVTPARLVTGLITEHGVFAASREGMARLRHVAAAEGAT